MQWPLFLGGASTYSWSSFSKAASDCRLAAAAPVCFSISCLAAAKSARLYFELHAVKPSPIAAVTTSDIATGVLVRPRILLLVRKVGFQLVKTLRRFEALKFSCFSGKSRFCSLGQHAIQNVRG